MTCPHYFEPGSALNRPLILLHGSGGGERELVALAREVAPGWALAGLRGSVEIDGGFAFFHRFPDRSIDEADIATRAPMLADDIEAIGIQYGLSKAPIAVGFSNGAIMAAALLLTRPALLAGAILFRPLSPFREDPPVRLHNTPVLIIDGAKDSRRSPGDGARLAERLKIREAIVTHRVLPVGHAITAEDRQIAADWLRGIVS